MAGRDLALPLDVEQVLPLLGRLLSLHLGGVVGQHDEARRGRVVEALRVEVPERRSDLGFGLRHVFFEPALGRQSHIVADVRRGEHVADRLVVLEILQQALVGDLRGGANDVDLDAVHLGEAASQILRAFGCVVRYIPGEFAFLLGALLQCLHVGAHRRRKGKRSDDREASQHPHLFLPETDRIIVGCAYDHTNRRATSGRGGERAHDGRQVRKLVGLLRKAA